MSIVQLHLPPRPSGSATSPPMPVFIVSEAGVQSPHMSSVALGEYRSLSFLIWKMGMTGLLR